MNNNSINKKVTLNEFNNMNSEEKILKIASGFVPPSGKPEIQVLNSILNNTEPSIPTKIFRLNRFIQLAAALFLLLFSVYAVNAFFIHKTVSTKFAEHSTIKLPDGTSVVLNADSKISWNNNKFNKNRQLNLQGEAYFDVKKGDKFIIKTKNGVVEILGTQLNIYSRKDNFWVSCMSGKVRVSSNNQQQIITPGEWVKLTAEGLQKSALAAVEKTISWKNGYFHFENTPLNVIFDEFKRQFGISIQYKGRANRKATVDFSNKNLSDALDIVCIPMELNYEIKKEKKVTIYEKE